MAKFEFGFDKSWFRLIIKNLPGTPDLFSSKPDAVEHAQTVLRIGKLKVGAAKVWAETAGIIQRKKKTYVLSPLGRLIATYDPQLEEDGIWWAIHYHLAEKESLAWFYAFYMNLFDHNVFDTNTLETELRNYWNETNAKTMKDSIYKTLIWPPFKQVFEGTPMGVEFGLFFQNSEGNYEKNPVLWKKVPEAVFAYALCDWAKKFDRKTAHISALIDSWGPGKIFCLDRETVDAMSVNIGEKYHKKVAWISHTANLNSISITDIPPMALLRAYYLELDGLEPMDALEQSLKEMKC